MKSQSSPPSSISLHLDRQQVLETKCYWNLLIKDIFQLYLWQTGWSLATMSCRSTQRRTSSMAQSASWWCPSSVDLEFTHIGWHTGRSILLEVFVTRGITLVHNQFLKKWEIFDDEHFWTRSVSLVIVSCFYHPWRALLKVTLTALWSEASPVSMWSTRSHSQIPCVVWCR